VNVAAFNLSFPIQYLKAALVVSFLSVWVLIGLFSYLNRYTKRGYFRIWTFAWLFYSVWLGLSIVIPDRAGASLLLMVKHCCIGWSAVFLVWGSICFLKLETPSRALALFLGFLSVWSYFGVFYVTDPLWVSLPIFALIAASSEVTAACFYRLRRREGFMGAGLLAFGFVLWGAYLGGYPFLQRSPELISCSFFIAAVLQLFIAVSMIILVLEEVRLTNKAAVEKQETETKLLQRRIVSTEERYQALFEQASEAIVIASVADLKILELNQAARRLLGVSRTQDLGGALRQYIPEITAKNSQEWFRRMCEKGEINLTKKDGGVTPAEVSGAPILFQSTPAYQCFFRELTERARLEQQLRQSEKLAALGQMISGIAHELNNPLAVVKGYLELILASHELGPRTRADLEKVNHESNRAAKLVANFLSFARESPLNRESVDLNELIDLVLETTKFELRVAGTELLLDLEGHLPPTLADPDQIEQVLVILINNAIQAMLDSPRPGKLVIRSEHAQNLVRISIQDNGPGILPQVVPHIFEPFFTTKQVGTGTGLGLSIAHSIVSAHGGKISYEPVPSGGAGFILEFPISAPTTAENPDHKMTTLNPCLPALEKAAFCAEILILDDERSIAELLGEMVNILGHSSVLCNSPLDALNILANRDFGIILSDFRMPGMNGQQFYEAICKIRPDLSDRVVFLTGDVVNPETQAFLKKVGNPHISKPFQLSNVETVLERILEENDAVSR
jgi:PAS domain S-box-containing protein